MKTNEINTNSGVFLDENENNQEITDILLETSESIRELNLVNYDFLRVINDDFSNLTIEDSELLHASIKVVEKLIGNEKVSETGDRHFSGNEEEWKNNLAELKHYLLIIKLKRDYYEMKSKLGNLDENAESYEEREKRIKAKRKKLREKRKKKNKKR